MQMLLIFIFITASSPLFAAGPAEAWGKRPPQARSARPCPKLKESREFFEGDRRVVEVVVKMDVDVDGAPNAYGPRGKKALDILEHARSPKESPYPGEIVGYMTEGKGGPPTIQGKNDPDPGYYVSQTDFADRTNKRLKDPRRYVDATRINYVVQGKVARRAGVVMGDYVTVRSCRTGKSAYAIVADSGNESGAEGSLALVRTLGYKIRDGIEDSVDDREIVIHYYPRSNPGKIFYRTQENLDRDAARLGLRR